MEVETDAVIYRIWSFFIYAP